MTHKAGFYTSPDIVGSNQGAGGHWRFSSFLGPKCVYKILPTRLNNYYTYISPSWTEYNIDGRILWIFDDLKFLSKLYFFASYSKSHNFCIS